MATLDKLLERTLSKDAYWPINKHMVKQIGLEASLILQHIMELKKVFKKNEIFQSQPEMAKELGITEYAVKNRIVELVKLGLISVVKKGTPCKNYYSTNTEKIVELMENEVNGLVDTKSTDKLVDLKINGQDSIKSTDSGVEINGLADTKSTDKIVSNQRISEYENISTNTKNTTNNTITKNINKEYTTNSFAGINYETLLDNMRDLNNENCADTISFIDTEIGWDTFMNNINYDSSAKQNFMNRIQNNAYNYGIELNFNK